MDALKGIHGFGTALFGILLLGFTYTFMSKLINAYNDSAIQILIWVSYIVINILFILVVPTLIIMQGSSNASVVSAVLGYGSYAFGVVVVNIFWWIMSAFINQGSFQDGTIATNIFTSFGQNSIPTQFLSFIFIIGLFLLVYIMPTIIMLFPEVVEDQVKEITGRTNG